MELFILTAISFAAGWKLSQIFYLFTFKKILEDLKVSTDDLRKLASSHGMELPEDAEDAKPSNILEVKLEKHGAEIFAYRKDNDQFLGQGADADALIKRLTENLTPCRVIVAKEDGADLLQNAGNSK